MKKLLPVGVGLALMLIAGQARGQDTLAAAEKLYGSAQYEEALKLLDELKSSAPKAPEVGREIEQNRALCLLALDRRADAERAIETILASDPFYQPGDDDAAPKVRAAFHDVRVRMLPAALQQLYARAKQAYDRKAYDEAASAFKQVLKLLDDPDLSLDKSAQSDMRLVARSFLDLSEAVAAAVPAPVPAAPPPSSEPETAPAGSGPAPRATAGPQSAAPQPSARSVDKNEIYDAASPEVAPPVALRQHVLIPAELRPLTQMEWVLDVLVRATGEVEEVKLRQSSGARLDALVLQAAGAWRYRPATKDGVPVRYRQLVKIVVPARSGG